MTKRITDIILTLVALILVVPVLVILGLFVFIRMGSPVLFRQTRPGKMAKPFVFYKFRTMTNKKDSEGNLLPDAQRMTKLGSFLRNSSLDELPSLFNVLKGDMSLVGPRPLLMKYIPLYNDFQNRRHEVKPGITGWAQINGRNAISWEEKFELDVWYVDNRSFWLDLKILFLTLWKVVKREGISAEGAVTMPEFTGNNKAEAGV